MINPSEASQCARVWVGACRDHDYRRAQLANALLVQFIEQYEPWEWSRVIRWLLGECMEVVKKGQLKHLSSNVT